MKRFINNDQGITLIELLIALSILTLITGAALSIMQQSSASYNKQNSDVNQQQNLRHIITFITPYVLQGTNTAVYEDNYINKNKITTSGKSLSIDGIYFYFDPSNVVRTSINSNPVSEAVGDFIVSKPFGISSQSVEITVYDTKKKYFLDTILTPRNK